MKPYEVKTYYTGYCTYEVEAENEETAIIKASTLPINKNEILSNLEKKY